MSINSKPGQNADDKNGPSASSTTNPHAWPPGFVQSPHAGTMMVGDATVATEPPTMPLPVDGRRMLGRYQILSELGRGGMGAVSLAEDTVLKRKVALKIPNFEPAMAEQMQARFMREAQIAAQLSHPNICRVYDVGMIEGQLVMAMEYIEGHTLAVLTKPGKLSDELQVVGLVKKIAQAIETAHKMGLVHRDLKPGNIMLAKADLVHQVVEPKVMDFGLAKSLESKGDQLTHSGMIVGTPIYMSKEQWSGKDGKLGPASDVYSLGVILYELLTGHLPYDSDEGEPPTAWFVKLVTQPQIPPSERRPELDHALDAIVMKAIAKEPQDRYRTMAELAEALDGCLLRGSSQASAILPQGRAQVVVESAKSAVAASIAISTLMLKEWRKIPRLFFVGGAAGALLLIVGGAWVVLRGGRGNGGDSGKVVAMEKVPQSELVEVKKEEMKRPDTKKVVIKKSVSSSTKIRSTADAPFNTKQARAYQEAWAHQMGTTVETTNSIGMKMVLCPPGSYTMGEGAKAVPVTFSRAFWIGKYEVTQSEWERVMGTTPWRRFSYMKEDLNCAVTCVSYQQALAFCEKLTQLERQEGRLETEEQYKLPTEAQWEFACRAGTTTRFSFGDDKSKLSDYGWYGGWSGHGNANAETFPHNVGMKKPNPFGLYDMYGNVIEWCSDWASTAPTGGADPGGPPTGSRRVLRGGSWKDTAELCQSSSRVSGSPLGESELMGFRVARVVGGLSEAVRDTK